MKNSCIDVVFDAILADEEICKLLYYNTEDWNEKPNLTLEQKEGLKYNNIFPFRFVSNEVEKKESYINVCLGRFREREGHSVEYGVLRLYVVSNIDIWRTNEGLRPVLIYEKLTKIFKTFRYGMGDLIKVDSDEYFINNSFQGYYLFYDVVDYSDSINEVEE